MTKKPKKSKKDKKKSSKGTSAASRKKGKGKLSKAERQRLQKEEEERRQREEEEARLLAELAEAERLEKERLEQEEIERLEAKQLEHRGEELEELRMVLEEKLEAAEKWKSDLRIYAKWDRFMLCDGSPDPTVPQEINTFLSLWAEEKHEDFQSVLKKSILVLNLIKELEFLLHETPSDSLPEKHVAHYQQTILELQNLLHCKFNNATEHLLKNAVALSDIDTGNMQTVIKNINVTLYIWANLNKNPRFRGYAFPEEAFRFDLPKPLALCSIAVRMFHTNYDHLSHQSLTFHPRIKEVEESKPADTMVLESSTGDWKPTEEDHKTTAESVIGTDEEMKSEGRKSVISSLSPRGETKSVSEAHGPTGEEPDKRTDSQLGDTSEDHSPSPLLNDDGHGDVLEDDVVDLRQFTSLGGVYYFDVLKLPPQCKQVNSWTMVQLLEGGLQTYCYPQESLLSTSFGVSQTERDIDILISPPVAVTFRIPNNVIFFEEPQVARWDPESKNWKTDAITDKIYSAELKELSFKMNAFHTFTLIQDSHLNMPYQSWELKPKGVNEVILTIISAFTELQLEIKDDRCMLSSLSSTDGDLSHLIGVWMTPLALKIAMKSAGLDVFPAEDSEKYVSINKKNEQAEKTAYREMAALSPSFAFGWSKWNLNSGYEQIVVKVKEHFKPDLPNDDSWSLYMLSTQRTQRLKITESSLAFSGNLYDHSEFHSTLYHILRDHSSAEAMERLKPAHHLFVDCVYQLLHLTKVLTYS
ncbi:dynein axonemal intermediate chain 7 isoform X2 [Ascaphus truei]|uniref:dynein axonemal intermediate chain 7 isoform X2 n=1 Tax=Ascaphus truei TaxID=8439 RepID=UPI003F590BDC